MEWTPPGRNALVLLAPGSDTARVRDDSVRPCSMAEVSDRERGSLCGGMDATRFLIPVEADGADIFATVAVGREVARYRISEANAGSPCRRDGRRSSSTTSTAPTLLDACVAARRARNRKPCRALVEGPRDAGRRPGACGSVSQATPVGPAGRGPCADRLPHWSGTGVRRLRILFHDPGPVALGAPRLIR